MRNGKVHTELLKITPAAKKMRYLAAGGNPVGEGGRGVKRMWSLLRMITLLILPQYGIADSCLKCYQNVKYGQTMTRSFPYHTYTNAGCYSQTNLETCKFMGKDYWVAKNLGAQTGRVITGIGSCPRGENHICFTKTGKWGY